MKRRALAALLLAASPTPAPAQAAASVALPLTPQAERLDLAPAEPLLVAPGVELVIRGEALADKPMRATLRIDDAQSHDYASRVNDERLLPPGPFTWRIIPAGARTTGGRVIDAQRIVRLTLFPASAGARLAIHSAALHAPPLLPAGARGFSFGPQDAPLFPGFERVTRNDARVEQGRAEPVLRPGVDALIGAGLRGVERARLPWPKGPARVSLWIEDVGEWETLPIALERRVRVNGRDFLLERRTPEQWIAQRYLAGQDDEAGADGDPWRAHGARRGRLVTGETEADESGVLIELAGESANSAFLSAALIEPAGARTALDDVETRRAQAFRDLWRVATPARAQEPHARIDWRDAQPQTARVALARGSGARLRIALRSDEARQVRAEWESALPMRLWWAQARLERRAVGLNLLEPRADFLRAARNAAPLRANEDRIFEAWIEAPPDALAGRQRARIVFTAQGETRVAPIEIDVLDADLPAPARPAGYYLDEAPHFAALPNAADARRRQTACDLTFLSSLGLTGNAPAFTTPIGAGADAFIVDALAAAVAGVAAPALAYAPAKRVRAQMGIGAGAAKLAQASAQLRALGLPAPAWSVADEPALDDAAAQDLAWWTQALRAADPQTKLAAQLNNRAQARLLDLIDVAIVNPGFGVDAPDVALARARGRSVWLYNTDAPRLSAGLWLKAVGAERYLQWHARMPTADPFDPTDGREADVQVLYPSVEPCPVQHDIHADLLAMAEGVADKRWLAWLEARPEPQARALFESIAASTPERWRDARRLLHDAGPGPLEAMRNAILDLARQLN
jgi:hypothetical protein